MGRTVIPVGDAQAIAGAGAADLTWRAELLPSKGIIGFIVAVNGAGNQLSLVTRVEVWSGIRRVTMGSLAMRTFVRRWSDSNLVPADADTRFSVPLNLGPMGRLDDRYQLAPGPTQVIVRGTAWAAAGAARLYAITSDEAPLGYTEIHGVAPYAAGVGGPSDYVPPNRGTIPGFSIETDVFDESYWMDADKSRRWVFDVGGAPDPILELERMEDGAALAGVSPRAYVIRGPLQADGAKYNNTRLAAYAATDEITTIHHVPVS